MNSRIVIFATLLLCGISGAVAQKTEDRSDFALKKKVAHLLDVTQVKFASRLHPEAFSSLKYTDKKLYDSLSGKQSADGYPILATIKVGDVERAQLVSLLQGKVEDPRYEFNFSPRYSFEFKRDAEEEGHILFDPGNKTARIIVGERRSYVAISGKLAEFLQELEKRQEVPKGEK